MKRAETDPSRPQEGVEEGITAEDRLAVKLVDGNQQPAPEESSETWKSTPRHRRSRWKICLVVLNIVFVILLILGIVFWYLKVIPRAVAYVNSTVEQTGQCSSLRLPLCHKYKVPYAYTVYPNSLGHQSQSDASEAINRYEPLVSVKCYSLLPLFLCSLFAPKCIENGRMVPPCKSLCQDTLRKCEFFLGVFTLTWPMDMDCDSLPESPDPEVCLGFQERKNIERVAQACNGEFRCDKFRCLPHSWVCDGFLDCMDSADEHNCSKCSPHQFHCGHSTCIDRTMVCDGIKDCPDGREERRCLRLSRNQGYSGEGRLEAYNMETTSWQPVCGDHWNTSTMSARACRMLGYQAVNETRLQDDSPPADVRVAVGTGLDVKRQMKTLFTKMHKGCSGESVFVYLKCQNFECGKSVEPGSGAASWRIVGGKESDPGAWPWLVALHGGPDEVFFCGGVLISEWWVLSAAHCVGNQSDTEGWTLKLGMTRRTSSPAFTQQRGLSDIVRHPDFSSVSLYSNDIVLLRLDMPVTFDDYLRPICLPPANLSMEQQRRCTVIGWGKPLHDDEADYQRVIHQVEVPIVEFNTCSKWYSSQEVVISDTMLCAGFEEGQKDACQGDSGGPLLCKENDHWFVAGVVSWGIKCAQPNLPGIYTNVPLYVKWIEGATREYGYPLRA